MPEETDRNSTQQNNDAYATVEIPTTEEERPVLLKRDGFGTSIRRVVLQDKSKRAPKLDPKDRTAFWLTIICICIVLGMWVADKLIPQESSLTSDAFDLFKYVVTASLGFFFGTSKKDKESKEN